jgi:hypothetical protein
MADLRVWIIKDMKCSWCAAPRGQRCRTKAGRSKPVPHTRRVEAWWKMQEKIYGGVNCIPKVMQDLRLKGSDRS